MKKTNTLCALMLSLVMSLGSVVADAQNLKFGKPSKEEWDFKAWDETPDAEAVVLCKTLKTQYHLRGESRVYDADMPNLSAQSRFDNTFGMGIGPGNTTMTYEVKLRTKILKDSGAGYANVDIVYFDDKDKKDDHDEFYSLKVMTFEMVNGKVKRKLVSNATFKDERIADRYKVRHIVVPDVKAGMIVEYQYTLFSPRFAFLYDWQLEEKIPVVYTRCDMEIPAFLNFDMKVPISSAVKRSVKAGTVTVEHQTIDLQAPKLCRTNIYLIESEKILPFAESTSGVKKEMANIHAKLKNKIDVPLEPLPAGKRHIMLNP